MCIAHPLLKNNGLSWIIPAEEQSTSQQADGYEEEDECECEQENR